MLATARRTSSVKPFLPSDIDRSRAVSRAAVALAFNRARPEEDAGDIIRRTWPQDRAALELVSRTATAPATTTTTTWATELTTGTQTAIAFIAQLGGAAAALIPRGLGLDLSGINQ